MRKEENPFLAHSVCNEPVGEVEGKIRDGSGGIARHRVRIISRRVRLCDPDNLIGGCKHLVDSLRHANIIPEDDPEAIKLEVGQEKVASYKNEETWVEVTYG